MEGYGYFTESGYKGRLPSGEWMTFATRSDYVEFLHEEEEAQDDVA